MKIVGGWSRMRLSRLVAGRPGGASGKVRVMRLESMAGAEVCGGWLGTS